MLNFTLAMHSRAGGRMGRRPAPAPTPPHRRQCCGRRPTRAPAASAPPTDMPPPPTPPPPLPPPPPPFTILGLPPTPELGAIAAVYLAQGGLGLARLALSFLAKDEFGLDPAGAALLAAAGAAPWVAKPLYGFLSDAVPLWGYRRRSYLVGAGLLSALAWAALASPALVATPAAAAAFSAASSLGTAAADVVVDSIVVERARGAPRETAGSLQSLCWGAAAVGGIASAYASGAAVAAAGPRPVFAATAAIPLLVVASAAFIQEDRVVVEDGGVGPDGSPPPPPPSVAARLKAQAGALVGALQNPAVAAPAAFVFAWQATPTPDSALFYFYTDALGMGPEFLGRVRLVGAVASLAGVAAYNAWGKALPLRTVFIGAALTGAALSATQLALVTGASRELGIPDTAFLLADTAVLAALGQAAFLPVLVLAARVCPPGVEATLFAALMSVLNAGSAVGSAAGGALTAVLGVGVKGGAAAGAAAVAATTPFGPEWNALPLLVGLCAAGSLAPLALLGLIPAGVAGEGEEEGEEEEEGGGA